MAIGLISEGRIFCASGSRLMPRPGPRGISTKPSFGSAGACFDGMLTRLGLAEAVQARAVLCATGAEVASAVASGRAAIGLTQASELIDAPGVAFAGFLPEAVNTWTPYAAAVTTKTQHPSTARAFIAFVTGPNGSARLKQAGWDVAPR